MAAEAEDDGPPQGVTVCVRLRPMFIKRPDGTPAREATCTRVVEMEGKAEKGCGSAVTKIYDPNDMSAKPREYAFDRSYWSCDGFKEDPARPGFNIPDGPDSKYVSQDMVWNDIGKMVMKNALSGYNCTVFAYGQSGAGKSYSVVGYPPNVGIIPNTIDSLYAVVDGNKDEKIRYQVEIAMLEVYMDEVYDLLEPRKKERQKLNVFINKGEVFVYDPKDRKNMDKIWRAARDKEQAEAFRNLGDANRSVRPTGMNPSSSRGHTIFMVRFRKEEKAGDAWVEKMRSKLSLVDLAGSERAHDTGLTGIGLEEGIAINQSLTMLGQVLQSLCKGERVNYRDKLTQLLAESLGGTAVTVMIAALSPADINYGDTLSTLRFADNAKKMPVKVKKQLDPTAQLIADLQEENDRLKKQIELTGGGEAAEQAMKEKEEREAKLLEAEAKLAEMQKSYADMEAKAQSGGRMRIAMLPLKMGDKEKINELNAEIERLKGLVQSGEAPKADLEAKQKELAQVESEAQERAQSDVAEVSKDLEAKVEAAKGQGQEKAFFEELLEARFTAAERLLGQVEAVKQLVGEAETGLGVPDDVVAERAAKVKEAEEAFAAAKADCEKLQDQASTLNLLHRYRASIMSLEKQATDYRVRELRAQLEKMQTSAEDQSAQQKVQEEEKAAMLAASKAAEDAKIAAEAALQEKMLEMQALMQERDQAKADASQAREAVGDQDELLEKQAAIEAIIESQKQSWEDKLKKSEEAEKKLKKSFEDCGLSVGEIMSIYRGHEGGADDGEILPHLVNLCEDAHEDGLIYLIPEGTSKVKQYREDDEEPGIKLHGTSLRPHHATLEYDASLGALNITAAAEEAVVWVNGDPVKFGAAPVLLQHGARVIFGNEFVFRYVDPKAKKVKKPALDEKGRPIAVDWQFAMNELSNKNGVDAEGALAAARDRLTAQFAEREEQLAEEQKLLEQRMMKEREQFENEIKALREAAVNGTAKDYQAVMVKEKEKEKTMAALSQFKSRAAQQQARAQWVRTAMQTAKDEAFELDIRLCRRQMGDLQPRIVEANRIATLHNRKVKYSFHCLDAVDPRTLRNHNGHRDAKIAAGVTFGLGLAGGVAGAAVGAVTAGPAGLAAGGAAGAQAAAALGTLAVSTAGAMAVGGMMMMTEDEEYDETVMPRRLLLQIKVDHLESGAVQLWPQQKFMDRFVKMLSFANGQSPDTFFDDEDARYEDIFWDEMDHLLVGTSAMGLTPLLRLGMAKETLTLRNAWGDVRGVVEMSMEMKVNTDGVFNSLSVLMGGGGGETTEACVKALKDKKVRGKVRFNRLVLSENHNNWAGFFVRFSWFDTHGRLSHESEVVESTSLDHTFSFEQVCTPDFLKFLARDVMAVQIRAYERGKVKDFELRDLRLKLRKAEAELTQYRGGKAKKMSQSGKGWFGGGSPTKSGELKMELALAKEEASKARKEADELKRALDLAEAQLSGKAPPKQNEDGSALRRRVEELEGQLREAKSSSGDTTKNVKPECCVM